MNDVLLLRISLHYESFPGLGNTYFLFFLDVPCLVLEQAKKIDQWFRTPLKFHPDCSPAVPEMIRQRCWENPGIRRHGEPAGRVLDSRLWKRF